MEDLKPLHEAHGHCDISGKMKPLRASKSNQIPKINLRDSVKAWCCDTWTSRKALCEHFQGAIEANFKLETTVSTLGFNSHI